MEISDASTRNKLSERKALPQFYEKQIDDQIRAAGKLGVAKETKEKKESPNSGQIISGVNFIPK